MVALRRTLLTTLTALTTAAGVAGPVTGPTASAAAPGTPKIPSSTDGCCTYAMVPGDTITSPHPNTSPGGWALRSGPQTASPYALEVQEDGKVVEYETVGTARRAVWSTGTAGAATPTRLTFQTDGNVVLYDRDDRALWSTGTAGRPAAFFDVYGNGQVVTQAADGRVLAAVGPAATTLPGFVVSYSGAGTSAVYDSVTVQDDGNVVAYRYDLAAGTSRAYWSTGTAGAGPVRFVAQSDGNLVLYQRSTGRAIWQSRTSGPTGYYQFDAQSDGNVVLYRTDGTTRVQAVWASGTHA